MVTKRSHILKQTCNFHLQVRLSVCDFFLPPGIKGSKWSSIYNYNQIDIFFELQF